MVRPAVLHGDCGEMEKDGEQDGISIKISPFLSLCFEIRLCRPVVEVVGVKMQR